MSKAQLQVNNTRFDSELLAMIDGLEEQKSPEGQYVWKKSTSVITYTAYCTKANGASGGAFTLDSSDVDLTQLNDLTALAPIEISRTSGGYTPTIKSEDGINFEYWLNGAYQNALTASWNKSTKTLTLTGTVMDGSNWTPFYYDTHSEKEFIDYVVSDDPVAYPDGGTQDGYWYELVEDYGYGMFFNEYDANGYPTDMKIVMPVIPENFMYLSGTQASFSLFKHVKKLEIVSNEISEDAFYYGMENIREAKIKLKTKVIGKTAFSRSNLIYCKIWLSNDCEEISTSSWSYSPFSDNNSTGKLYCEASSRPSGWGAYWNYYGNGDVLTTTWGVTEEQFDAL